MQMQADSQPTLSLMSLNDETTSGIRNSPAPWTSVVVNDLFVPSPAKNEELDCSPVRAERRQVPDLQLEVCSSADASTTSVVSAVEPWFELHDTVMQQVFGVNLQQLQHGGQQVGASNTCYLCKVHQQLGFNMPTGAFKGSTNDIHRGAQPRQPAAMPVAPTFHNSARSREYCTGTAASWQALCSADKVSDMLRSSGSQMAIFSELACAPYPDCRWHNG